MFYGRLVILLLFLRYFGEVGFAYSPLMDKLIRIFCNTSSSFETEVGRIYSIALLLFVLVDTSTHDSISIVAILVYSDSRNCLYL